MAKFHGAKLLQVVVFCKFHNKLLRIDDFCHSRDYFINTLGAFEIISIVVSRALHAIVGKDDY